MAIPKGHKDNFDTLKEAFANKDVCLLECERVDGDSEPVFVICAVTYTGDGECDLTPFAKMFDGNPYEEVRPVDDGEKEG